MVKERKICDLLRPVCYYRWNLCDAVKQTESDVWNINLQIYTSNSRMQFLLCLIVLSSKYWNVTLQQKLYWYEVYSVWKLYVSETQWGPRHTYDSLRPIHQVTSHYASQARDYLTVGILDSSILFIDWTCNGAKSTTRHMLYIIWLV